MATLRINSYLLKHLFDLQKVTEVRVAPNPRGGEFPDLLLDVVDDRLPEGTTEFTVVGENLGNGGVRFTWVVSLPKEDPK